MSKTTSLSPSCSRLRAKRTTSETHEIRGSTESGWYLELYERGQLVDATIADMAADPPNINVARLLGVGFEGSEATDFGLGIDVDFMQGIIPTTENIVVQCWRVLEPHVAPGRLARLRLWETENNYAEYEGR